MQKRFKQTVTDLVFPLAMLDLLVIHYCWLSDAN